MVQLHTSGQYNIHRDFTKSERYMILAYDVTPVFAAVVRAGNLFLHLTPMSIHNLRNLLRHVS